ncbi:mitochondrial import receptor subunit TOM22 homolog [Gracilinanus agilis]|uniref:mitochondrial import receptor subunit TOM22 homolog n=1 Tax=Gracilinanus agilis TaxID=191870 RepID=UPI001CFC847A|nr:mitochondrial import receptor subunit TOM22 homolog [Gracilinanus agilis]
MAATSSSASTADSATIRLPSNSLVSTDELLLQGSTNKAKDQLEDNSDDELDKTLAEKLWGLTELFPESVQTSAGATFDLSLTVVWKTCWFSREVLWIWTTSFMILILPVVFEMEKLQMEQQQQQLQQQKILLGPNTDLSEGKI